MNRHLMSLIIGAAIILTVLSSAVSAGTIEAQVLQYKLDHFYFNVGKESLVFPGHHFAIVRGKDTVVSGVIGESYDGVSIGTGALPKDGKRNFEKYKAVVQTAETERLNTIRIGTFWHEVYSLDTGNATPLDSVDVGDRSMTIINDDTLRVQYFDDSLLMLDKLERGELDGLVLSGAAANRAGFHTQSSHTPIFVMLLSNLSTDPSGNLATSLYYRFDPKRLNLSIADSCVPINSFHSFDDRAERPYPFDPEKGKQLFRSIRPLPSLVRIGIMSEHLRPLAMYFGDLLAREQCRSTIVVDPEGTHSDLYLGLGIVSEDIPDMMYDLIGMYIYQCNKSNASTAESSTIQHFEKTLDSAHAYSAASEILPYVERSCEILTRDMGCFPLFRPQYNLITRNDLVGLSFDKRGRLVMTNPTRIKLPREAIQEPK